MQNEANKNNRRDVLLSEYQKTLRIYPDDRVMIFQGNPVRTFRWTATEHGPGTSIENALLLILIDALIGRACSWIETERKIMQTTQMQTARLSNKYVHTLERIFEHPTSHNLEWMDVISLVEHLGTVEETANGHLTLTLNGISQSFHHSQDKEVSEVQQILDLRHFLENAGVGKKGVVAAEATTFPSKLRLLVVISQKETRVFQSEGKGSVPEHLHPYDPRGMLHHLDHTRGGDITSHLPENLTYYKAIAETLVDADEILLMGNGTAGSSAMTHLKEFLTTHHPEVAQKIVGALTRDLEALTEGELLQEARAFWQEQA
jgi:hypothetical protein